MVDAGVATTEIQPVNLITATPLRKLPVQRAGFLLSKAPEWLARAFDEEPMEAQLKTFNFLHTARWVYLGRFPRTDRSQPRERWWGPRWVVYVANYDGPWEPYFGTFMEAMAEGVYDVWGQSVGFPGFPAAGTANDLRRWLATRLPPIQHYYCAYPQARANDVRAAVRVRREVASLALDLRHGGVAGDQDVTPRFDELVVSLGHCLGPIEPSRRPRPAPEPGVLPDGSVRGLVAVFPVKTGGSAAGTDGDGVDHEEELRRLLTDLPSGGDSPFGRIAGVHFARLALLDRRCIGVHPRRRDCIQPRCSYLLLAADFDAGAIQPGAGSPDETYLRAMYETMTDEVDAAFSHCWGYEPSSGGDGFVRLALRCRRPFLREFIDCPDQSLGSVLAALEGHGRLLDLIRRRDADGTVDAAALYALADSG